MKQYYGNYLGICVSNTDPEYRGRVKIFIPHIMPALYDQWNKKGLDIQIKSIGNNLQGALDAGIVETLSKILPWSEACSPILGTCTAGHYNNETRNWGQTSADYNNRNVRGVDCSRVGTLDPSQQYLDSSTNSALANSLLIATNKDKNVDPTNPGVTTGITWCASISTNALRSVLGVKIDGTSSLAKAGGNAENMGPILQTAGFIKVPYESSKKYPPGSAKVSAGGPYGHMELSTGDGNWTWSSRGANGPFQQGTSHVYIPTPEMIKKNFPNAQINPSALTIAGGNADCDKPPTNATANTHGLIDGSAQGVVGQIAVFDNPSGPVTGNPENEAGPLNNTSKVMPTINPSSGLVIQQQINTGTNITPLKTVRDAVSYINDSVAANLDNIVISPATAAAFGADISTREGKLAFVQTVMNRMPVRESGYKSLNSSIEISGQAAGHTSNGLFQLTAGDKFTKTYGAGDNAAAKDPNSADNIALRANPQYNIDTAIARLAWDSQRYNGDWSRMSNYWSSLKPELVNNPKWSLSEDLLNQSLYDPVNQTYASGPTMYTGNHVNADGTITSGRINATNTRSEDSYTGGSNVTNLIHTTTPLGPTPVDTNGMPQGMFAVPNVGSFLWVFFQEGNPLFPVYFGASFGSAEWNSAYKASSESPKYPSNADGTKHYAQSSLMRPNGSGGIQFDDTYGDAVGDLRNIKIFSHTGSHLMFGPVGTVQYDPHASFKQTDGHSHDAALGNRETFTQGDDNHVVQGDHFIKIGNISQDAFDAVTEHQKILEEAAKFLEDGVEKT